MAIVKMEFVKVIASKNCYKEMIINCSHCDYFHVELASTLVKPDEGEKVMEIDNHYADAMNTLRNLSIQAGHEINYDADLIKYTDQELQTEVSKLNTTFTNLLHQQKQNVQLSDDDKVAMDKLRLIGYKELNSTMFVKVVFGKIPVNSVEKLDLMADKSFDIVQLHKNEHYNWICAVISKENYIESMEKLVSLYFEELPLPEVDVEKIAKKYSKEIDLLYKYCSYRNDLYKYYKFVRVINDKYVIAGFMPKDKVSEFKAIFDDYDMEVVVEDPKTVEKIPQPTPFDSSAIANKLKRLDIDRAGQCQFLHFTFGVIKIAGYNEIASHSNHSFKIFVIAEKGIYKWILCVTTKDKYREIQKILDDADFLELDIDQNDLNDIITIMSKENSKDKYGQLNTKFTNLDEYFKVDEKQLKVVKVPTLLRNSKLTSPFEVFVNMYGEPSYDSVDPTLFVSITYMLLFGIMFGDFGQGLVLVILGFVLSKKNPENKLFQVFERIGVSSMFFGFIYGSFFGLEHVFDPINLSLFNVKGKLFDVMAGSSTMVLIGGALMIGVVLNLISMIISTVEKGRSKKIGELLFNQNGIAGIVFYSYMIFFAIEAATKIVYTNKITNLIFILVPIILMFLEEPLTNLIDNEGFAPKAGWGNYFSLMPFEIFEIMLSFVTNTMSYLRIGGFVLSHAGMMMVVMVLTEMAGHAGFLVLILGNIFVMCLEGLIVGIQALRLELYEMFSRYFVSGGKKFKSISNEN